jgi:uncharacterized Zn finger protein
MEITILVKSSSRSEPRTVHVRQDDSGLSFFCDCPAGNWGRICKHKVALASADDSMLYDEDQRKNFKKVMGWVAQSGYPDLVKELKEAEKELGSAREKVGDIKVKITRAMAEGLK